VSATLLAYAAPGGFTCAGWHTHHMRDEATEGRDAVEMRFTARELRDVRRFVWSYAEGSLGKDRADDLVLAVNELATNSVRHGGGTGTLRMWTEPDVLVCEIHDAGDIADPQEGCTPPTPDQPSGRGLWVVRQLVDLTRISSLPTGTVVRVQMQLS
jgi:anti-sigma regulatory factor (Ser/Thr protein kinase)